MEKIIKAKTDSEANEMNGSNDKYKTAWEMIINQYRSGKIHRDKNIHLIHENLKAKILFKLKPKSLKHWQYHVDGTLQGHSTG